MLRRRETSTIHQHGPLLPTRSAASCSSNVQTPLPMVRNHSVATSNPSFQERANVVRSYFSRGSSSSLSSTSTTYTRSIPSWLYYIPAFLLMLTPWLSPHHLKENIQTYQTQILWIQKEQQELVKQLEGMTTSIQDYNTKIHVMNKEQNARYQDLRQNEGTYNHAHLSLDKEQYAQVEKEEDGLLRRIDALEKHIQKVSAKLVVQKFGSNDNHEQLKQPYRVKVNVMDLRGEVSFFVVELAPISEMPYAVYYFLQMVDLKLWDGLALMLNGGTTVTSANHWMATTMQMDIRYGLHSWEGKRFEDANLKHMAFTEHSPTYPPRGQFQYSLAFSGHPGGPSFYIRLDQDSAEEHILDIHQQSSTFAMVIEGMDVLQKYSAGAMPNELKIDSNDEVNNYHPKGGRSDHVRMLTIQSMELLVL